MGIKCSSLCNCNGARECMQRRKRCDPSLAARQRVGHFILPLQITLSIVTSPGFRFSTKDGGFVMRFMRLAGLALLVLLVCSTAALAQRSGPQFRRPLACEPFEPRTKLEALEWRYERVLVKGFTRIANLQVRGATIRLDAVEMKEQSLPTIARGLVIAMFSLGEQPHENRTYVDYEEIDNLLKAMEGVARVNESVTKLASFEARYRTVGDLEVVVFRQGRASGTAASVTSGICDRVTGLLTLDELETLRAHIVEAKVRLDEAK